RARAEPALEDDRAVAGQLVGAGREALQLDVPRARYAARLPLVRLAHVHQLDLAALQAVPDLLGLELVLAVGEGAHRSNVLAACRRKHLVRYGTPNPSTDRPRRRAQRRHRLLDR